MKKIFVVSLAVVLAAILYFLFHGQPAKPPASLPSALDFVRLRLRDDRGLIETYPYVLEKVPSRPDYRREALSESAGLWMQILLAAGERELFQHQVEQVNRFFLLKNQTLSWRLDLSGEVPQPSEYSATIDDLRIIRALLEAGEAWARPDYIRQALEQAAALKHHAVRDGLLLHQSLVYEGDDKDRVIDLSYLDLKALQKLAERDPEWQPILRRSREILEKGMRPNGFSYDKYDARTGRYYDVEKNLINQLIVAIHRIEAGGNPGFLLAFLETEYARHHRLFGRYDPETLEPLVRYESPAVEALTARLAWFCGKKDFAEKIMEKIRVFAGKQSRSEWRGALCKSACHSFDHLQALLTMAIMERSN
ncbi:MAG: glycosyl hydrolase family 8 [Candidatus Omnitrophota bacterium]